MSNPEQIGAEPQPTRGDRIRMSMRQAGVSSDDMEEYLGVTRYTVSRWLNDRGPMPIAMMRLWALRTGVPYGWLKDGDQPPNQQAWADELAKSFAGFAEVAAFAARLNAPAAEIAKLGKVFEEQRKSMLPVIEFAEKMQATNDRIAEASASLRKSLGIAECPQQDSNLRHTVYNAVDRFAARGRIVSAGPGTVLPFRRRPRRKNVGVVQTNDVA